MGNFDVKVQRFLDILIGKQAYLQVLEGLQNTLTIAITGLIIGIIIGTLIATVRIVPKYKLLPRAIRKIFNMKTYECDFPLKHPNFVIADSEHKNEVEKILARNRPFRSFYRKIEVIFLFLRYRGFGGVIRKFKKRWLYKSKNR